jgi:PAS domain S-box-containing protein
MPERSTQSKLGEERIRRAGRRIRGGPDCRDIVKALNEATRQFQTFVDASPLAIVATDTQSRVTIWNPAAERIFGWAADEAMGRELPYITEASRQEYTRLKDAVLAGESIAGVEVRRTRRDGSPIDLSLSIAPLRDDEGRIHGIMSVSADISQRRAAERELVEAKERLQALFDSSPLAIHALDAQSCVVLWNRASERLFGWTAEEVIGHAVPVVPPDKMAEHLALRERFYHGDDVSGVEVRRMKKDGTPVDVRLSAAILRDADGQVVGGMGVYEDVTERKRAEEALRSATARQREFMRDVFLSVTDGKFHYCGAEQDLPKALSTVESTIYLTSSSGLAELRRNIRIVTERMGFPDDRVFDLLSATGEASMNAVVHAGGGRARIRSDPERETVQVWVEDTGHGISIEQLPRATLELGFTTAGTMGHGFKIMLQTADRAWLLTNPSGTTVVMEQDKVMPESNWVRAYEHTLDCNATDGKSPGHALASGAMTAL